MTAPCGSVTNDVASSSGRRRLAGAEGVPRHVAEERHQGLVRASLADGVAVALHELGRIRELRVRLARGVDRCDRSRIVDPQRLSHGLVGEALVVVPDAAHIGGIRAPVAVCDVRPVMAPARVLAVLMRPEDAAARLQPREQR